MDVQDFLLQMGIILIYFLENHNIVRHFHLQIQSMLDIFHHFQQIR